MKEIFQTRKVKLNVFYYLQGGDAGSVTASAVGTPGGPAPPPPPGPPPPPPPADVDSVASSGDGDRNALFNSINKGTEVTKGKQTKTKSCNQF